MSVCLPTLHGVRKQKATIWSIHVMTKQKIALLNFAENEVELKSQLTRNFQGISFTRWKSSVGIGTKLPAGQPRNRR